MSIPLRDKVADAIRAASIIDPNVIPPEFGMSAIEARYYADAVVTAIAPQGNTSAALLALVRVSGPHTRSSIPVASTGHTAEEEEER